MKSILAIPALALTLATPALAQQVAPGAAGAIAHFNQSADAGDRIVLAPGRLDGTTRSTRGGDLTVPQRLAIESRNASADAGDRIVLPDGRASTQGFATTGDLSGAMRRAVDILNDGRSGNDRIVLR